MTSQQLHKAGQDSNVVDLYGAAKTNIDLRSVEPAPVSFGSRLRAARQARGLDLESCGHALKLPTRVLRQLEDDERDGIDYAVYLGSYISKYARHLGLDEALVQKELQALRHGVPTLVATGGISHSRYLLERYATAATYVVLTAVIVVPMIWLGVRGTLDRDISHFAPLDASPVAQQEAPADRSNAVAVGAATSTKGPTGNAAPAPPPAAPAADEQPLMASMAPFPNLVNDSSKPAEPNSASSADNADNAVSTDAPAAGHSLSLDLANASWVEVVAGDGSHLQYGLLPAGSTKTWHSDQPLEVRIGNASGAQVSVDGQPVALDDYRHANVAHFRVQVQDGKATPSDF